MVRSVPLVLPAGDDFGVGASGRQRVHETARQVLSAWTAGVRLIARPLQSLAERYSARIRAHLQRRRELHKEWEVV